MRCELREWSASRGAHLSFQSCKIECKRATAPSSFTKKKEKRRTKRGIAVQQRRTTTTTRCGCQFVIRFARASVVILNAPVAPVCITEGSFYRHTNGYFPCQSQLISDKRRSGAYGDDVKKEEMASIMSMLKHGQNVPCPIMPDMLRPLYPSSVAITAQMVTFIRLKVSSIKNHIVFYWCPR